MATRRVPFTPPPPATLALGAVVLVLAVITTSVWVSAGSARRELRIARADLAASTARADGLQADLADLRGDLQARQGVIEDLQDEIEDLQAERDDLTGSAEAAQQAALDAATSSAAASEAAATVSSLAEVTTLIGSTPQVTRAFHVTEVIDATTLVGFDLREMLADGPRAGESVRISLASTRSPAEGDCRHTQSRALATAWLDATGFDVLLRRPPEAPATAADGSVVGEVLAFTNPASSLNVTLIVAGEAVIDEPATSQDPNLTERMRVAQASAEPAGIGVWGCQRSALLGTGGATPSPAATPTAQPSAGDATPPAGSESDG